MQILLIRQGLPILEDPVDQCGILTKGLPGSLYSLYQENDNTDELKATG